MAKRLMYITVTVLLCAVFTVSSSALNGEIVPRLADGADILSASEETALLQKLDSVSEEHQFDVVIITVENLHGSGKTNAEFADDIYDYNDFGFGSEKNGVLLLINMDSRDWFISTTGYGMTAFTDDGCEYIGEKISSELSDGNYYEALDLFAGLCDDFLVQAETGEPYTSKNLPREKLSLIWIPGSIILGMGISLAIMYAFRSQLKSVRRKPSANDYRVPGSLQITQSSEMFLYQHISRVPRQTQNSSSGGVRVGSSGRSHGGAGGKF